MNDDLVLTLGGQAIAGWTGIRITRGIERCPSDFEITLTELYPGELAKVIIEPGMPCTVQLGGDLVITGYVDRFIPSIDAGQHSIRVMGRSKCCDLVDCSAVLASGQVSNGTVLTLAQLLCEPYGITAKSTVADLPINPQFNLNLGESPFDAIERCARWSAVLVYDTPDGNLLLTRVDATQAAGGFVEGVNVQAASIEFCADQRYSIYQSVMYGLNPLLELGNDDNTLATVRDPNCPRFRQLDLIAGGGGATALDVAKQMAQWEASRRAGRSKVVRIKTDSWRDSAGALWSPNTFARVALPSLKLTTDYMTIGEVTYMRNPDQGTTAELVLMEASAFVPQPIVYLPTFGDVPVVQPS